jgi:hypothetical protein
MMVAGAGGLLDYLIGPLQQRLWNSQAERLRRLEIDHEEELC